MKSTTKSKRRPEVADRNAENAQANIALKLAYLKAQVGAANKNAPIPAEVLKALPKSRSQFNRWASESIPREQNPPFFTSNAPQTLRSDIGTAKAVDLVVAQVPRLRAEALERSNPLQNKIEKVAVLKREVRTLKVLNEIGERELAKYQALVEALREEVRTLRAADASNTREFERALSHQRKQLEEASQKSFINSDTKVVSIKPK